MTTAVETSAALMTTDEASGRILVVDGAMPDPDAYRAFALAQTYQRIETGPDEVWHGIARLPADSTLPRLIQEMRPSARPHLTFFRKSPYRQPEPNFIHSDEGMGEFTAILYLNPTPPAQDGTTFWWYRPTGAVYGSARDLPKDADQWEPWHRVEARFNRLVIFDSLLFHSRAIQENYGDGENARLVQVVFGRWER